MKCEVTYASPIYNFTDDERPFIDIKIKGRVYPALIDSGSQLTVIDKSWITNPSDWGVPIPKIMKLTTVDNTTHSDNEMMLVRYEFNNQQHELETTLLNKPMDKIIVGTEFMEAFGLQIQLKKNIPLPCTNENRELTNDERTKEMKEFKRAIRRAQKPAPQVFITHKYKNCAEIQKTREESCMFKYVPKRVEDFERPKQETVAKPHVLENWQQKELDRVKKMFEYTSTEGELNATDKIVHHIDTGDAEPVVKRQYPLSPYQLIEAKKKIQEMEKLGIVQRITHSNWRSPMLPVPKPDGSLRICLDAKGLNKVTIVNTYPMADVNVILAQLKKTQFITAIDLSQAFFQVRLDEESQLKTAFVVGNQLYCYKRMTMGLRNSPATLASLIESVFKDLEPEAFAYCDDFLICTETFERHLELLEIIAKRLKEAKLSISSTKSNFCCSQVKFLGYLLSEKGLEIDPERKKAIQNYKKPVTVKQVRSFLGAVGWISRFIAHFADKSAPLIELIKGTKKKTAKVKWTEEAERAFQVLKDEMTSETVLSMCDYEKQFHLYTDASDLAGSGILMQESDGGKKPIFYYSFKFNNAERNYSTSERECLAVLRSLEKFSPYVKGSILPVLVYTDHAALKYLKTMKSATGRLSRWSIRADEFNFEVVVVRGKDNELADCLSREIEYESNTEASTSSSSNNNPKPINSENSNNLSTSENKQVNCIEKEKTIELIEKSTKIEDAWYLKTLEKTRKGLNDRYKIVNDELYFRRPVTVYNDKSKWVLCIPKEKRQEVFHELHDQKSHPGSWRTVSNIKNKYHWPGLYDHTYTYVSKCQTCRLTKPSTENRKIQIGEYRDPQQPGRILSIDFVGPFPRSNKMTALFVVIDCFSKYLFVKPMMRPTAKNVVKYLEEFVFDINGTPAEIISDNGQQFTSKLFQDMCQRRKIRHQRTAIYHPRANPVESTNKTIKNALKAKLLGTNDHSTWEKHVKQFVSDFNSTVHSTTQASPYFLQFGREKVTSGDEFKRLIDVNNETIHSTNENEIQNQTQHSNEIDDLKETEVQRKLITEQVLENNRKIFDRNVRNQPPRACKKKFDIGTQIYFDNHKLSNKSEKFSQGLSARKKTGYIKKPIGDNMYEVVDTQNNTTIVLHTKNIYLQ